jgi:hypothetical protein
MTLIQDFEPILAKMTRAEKAELLQRVARDIGDARLVS